MPLSLKVAPVVLASSFLIGALLPGAARSVGVGQGKAHNRSTAAVAHARRGAEQVGRREGARADAAKSSCYASASVAGGVVRFATLRETAGATASLGAQRQRSSSMIVQAPGCATKVIVGHAYRASLRYSSTARSVAIEVFAHSRAGWRRWYSPESLKPRKTLARVSVLLRSVQGGVDRLAIGLVAGGRGTTALGGVSLTDVSAHPGTSIVTVATPAIPALTKSLEPSAPVEEHKTEETGSVESRMGNWEVLESADHARSVHAVLLQNGKVLIMAGSGNSRMEFEKGTFKSFIYNPVTNAWKELFTPKDVFCSGHVQLANGNVLILGGTNEYPPAPKPGEYPSTVYKGENMSWIFNIRTEAYEQVPYDEAHPSNEKEPGPLLGGTWYPSATELGNGDVISFGGLNEEGAGSTKTNYYTGPGNAGTDGDLGEEWVGWDSSKLQQTYDWFWGLYPSMILTADGRLFYDGSHVFGNGIEGEAQAPSGSSLYDFYCTPGKSKEEEENEQNHTNANAEVVGPNGTYPRIQDTPGLQYPNLRDQSASLLLPPAQAQKVMIMGGGNTYETEQNATDSTDEIDLEETNPHWVAGPNLPRGTMEDGSMEPEGAGKMYVSAVALPDGTVMETGGSLRPRTDNVHEAAIFNPTTNQFSPVAADPVGRDYHSEALLLPDGRVLTLGSNPIDLATGEETFETRISIYKPPYLFKGTRPTLDLIDGQANTLEGDVNKTTQWEYGSEHTLTYEAPSSHIVKAVLIRPAAVTHSSDPNQREVELPIEVNPETAAGRLKVSLTSNPDLAPPGYYMVFLVNAEGVPSVSQWVHVGPQGAP